MPDVFQIWIGRFKASYEAIYSFLPEQVSPSQHFPGDVSTHSFCGAAVGLAGVSGRDTNIKIIQRFKIKQGINALLSTQIKFCGAVRTAPETNPSQEGKTYSGNN
jgi:hypothetical protein